MKNVRLMYVLETLYFSWFWLAIWVFYYLNFTDYQGIGIVETIMVAGALLTEIPTGGIADLLGKKKTLIISFFLYSIGSFVMAFSQSFTHLIVSVLIMVVAGSLHSGTSSALVYDSLKEEGLESQFDKVQGNIYSLQNISIAVFGLSEDIYF